MNVVLLKRLVEQKGFTPESLAPLCGVKANTMRNIFRGLRPSLPVLKLLASSLECRIEDLDPTYESRQSKAAG